MMVEHQRATRRQREVLRILGDYGPMTILRIAWHLSLGTEYIRPALSTLERRGMVVVRRRRRWLGYRQRVYVITLSGREAATR